MADYLEIWRDLPGFTGIQVSNMGQMRSCRKGNVRYLKPHHQGGYWQTTIQISAGKFLHTGVHRMVMLAFVGPSSLQVNHKNGQKKDNRLGNLEYVTHDQNMKHAAKLGLRPRGCKNWAAVLNEDKVREIRKRHSGGETQKSLAYEMGVHAGTIQCIVENRTWKHLL